MARHKPSHLYLDFLLHWYQFGLHGWCWKYESNQPDICWVLIASSPVLIGTISQALVGVESRKQEQSCTTFNAYFVLVYSIFFCISHEVLCCSQTVFKRYWKYMFWSSPVALNKSNINDWFYEHEIICDCILSSIFVSSQLAFYANLHRAVIGPSATLTGRWRPDKDLRRMLTGIAFIVFIVIIPVFIHCGTITVGYKWTQELIQSEPHHVLNIKWKNRQIELNCHKKNKWRAELATLSQKA